MEEEKEPEEEILPEEEKKEDPIGKFLARNIDLMIVFIVGVLVLIFDLVFRGEYKIGCLILALGLGVMGSRGYYTLKAKAGLALEIVSFVLAAILLVSYLLGFAVAANA